LASLGLAALLSVPEAALPVELPLEASDADPVDVVPEALAPDDGMLSAPRVVLVPTAEAPRGSDGLFADVGLAAVLPPEDAPDELVPDEGM
jgi:hypothetical protein